MARLKRGCQRKYAVAVPAEGIEALNVKRGWFQYGEQDKQNFYCFAKVVAFRSTRPVPSRLPGTVCPNYAMPQVSTHLITPDCDLIRWQISETEATLIQQLTLTDEEETDLGGIAHPGQRLEWLACRVALKTLVEAKGGRYEGLWKDEYGKPHLIGLNGESTRGESTPGDSTRGHISLSHTPGWATAVWHQTKPVGLDIEPIRDQFTRVVPRVLSASEIADANGQPDRLAVYWCAKEALYKLYGKRQLTFREHLLVDPFPPGATCLTGHVRLPDHNETLSLCCLHVEPGLVIVAC